MKVREFALGHEGSAVNHLTSGRLASEMDGNIDTSARSTSAPDGQDRDSTRTGNTTKTSAAQRAESIMRRGYASFWRAALIARELVDLATGQQEAAHAVVVEVGGLGGAQRNRVGARTIPGGLRVTEQPVLL